MEQARGLYSSPQWWHHHHWGLFRIEQVNDGKPDVCARGILWEARSHTSLELPADYVFEMMAEQAAVVPTPHEAYLSEFAQWADQRIFFVDSLRCLSLWTLSR